MPLIPIPGFQSRQAPTQLLTGSFRLLCLPLRFGQPVPFLLQYAPLSYQFVPFGGQGLVLLLQLIQLVRQSLLLGAQLIGSGGQTRLFRLQPLNLGSYRGLSEALVGYARIAEGVDWTQWEEARF